ncbi:hypothetical protein PR048_019192 [Dryococelus australis]|uniref:Uncharacterized protein n=1 Tax=Dryococelus australis TaxID=614101 RepID=A0ABQ9H2T5_9NEOP|nr:hypothetical protein PR048_019192 [Dryococelus australis]
MTDASPLIADICKFVSSRVVVFRSVFPLVFGPKRNLVCTVQRYGGNTARLARRSDEALGLRVIVARIAPSLLDLGRATTFGGEAEPYIGNRYPNNGGRNLSAERSKVTTVSCFVSRACFSYQTAVASGAMKYNCRGFPLLFMVEYHVIIRRAVGIGLRRPPAPDQLYWRVVEKCTRNWYLHCSCLTEWIGEEIRTDRNNGVLRADEEIVYGWKEHLKSNPVIPIKPHMIGRSGAGNVKKNIKAFDRVNVDLFTQNKRPCPQRSHIPFFVTPPSFGILEKSTQHPVLYHDTNPRALGTDNKLEGTSRRDMRSPEYSLFTVYSHFLNQTFNENSPHVWRAEISPKYAVYRKSFVPQWRNILEEELQQGFRRVPSHGDEFRFTNMTTVVKTTRFPPIRTGFHSRTRRGVVLDDAVGRWVLSVISRFPRPYIPGATPYSPRFTIIGSQDHDVTSRPNLSPPLTIHWNYWRTWLWNSVYGGSCQLAGAIITFGRDVWASGQRSQQRHRLGNKRTSSQQSTSLYAVHGKISTFESPAEALFICPALGNAAPIIDHLTIVCPNHVQFSQEGRDFTSTQQPLEKRRIFQYTHSASVAQGQAGRLVVGGSEIRAQASPERQIFSSNDDRQTSKGEDGVGLALSSVLNVLHKSDYSSRRAHVAEKTADGNTHEYRLSTVNKDRRAFYSCQTSRIAFSLGHVKYAPFQCRTGKYTEVKVSDWLREAIELILMPLPGYPMLLSAEANSWRVRCIPGGEWRTAF